MLTGGLLISYANGPEYLRTLDKMRFALTTQPQTGQRVDFKVPRHRVARSLGRYQVAVFDEQGNSELDLLLIGSTMYILGVRLAEQKWFFSDNQPKEFAGCDSEKAGDLGFECSYPKLGFANGLNMERLRLGDCSRHVASLKAYLRVRAGVQNVDPRVTEAAKLAFAYFAVTVGEALRFGHVAQHVAHDGVDFLSIWPWIQNWVVRSSVSDMKVPAEILVVGIHESRKSPFFKSAADACTIDFVGEFRLGGRADLAKLVEDLFDSDQPRFPGWSPKTIAEAESMLRSAILDAYLVSRIDAGALGALEDQLRQVKSGVKNRSALGGVLKNFA